jgi:glycosyltransferase involved in cell wall biosynthesis
VTRVLHLITRFLGGGAETTLESQVEGLLQADRRYDVQLGYGLEFDDKRAARMRECGVSTTCFDHIRHYSLLYTLPAVVQVARFLRFREINVLHTHSTEAGIIGRWAAKLAGTPVVIHEIHGDPVTADRSRLLNGFLQVLERVSAPLATRIIVKSERIRDSYLERGIGHPEQYELIYHGIDIEQFQRAERASLPGDDDAINLVFIGRLQDGKGLPDLLAAVDRLDQDDIELAIAGKGPLDVTLTEMIAERGLDESVHLLGYRDDIPAILHSADVLVLPSYREGTPRVISEALASGTPVVSTSIAGIPEQVEHGICGLLIEPGDVDALVESLTRLIDSSELRKRMSEACHTRVAQFMKEREQRLLTDLYDRLLSDIEGGS